MKKLCASNGYKTVQNPKYLINVQNVTNCLLKAK